MRLFAPIFCALLLFFVTAAGRDAQAATKSVFTTSQAVIQSVLEMSVSEIKGKELRFGNVTPSDQAETLIGPQTIEIKVNSNSGEQYQVTQNISNNLTNANGAEISLQHLTFTSRASGAGGTGVDSPAPASKDSQTVYVSDNNGLSAVLAVEYLLHVPAKQQPGDYSTSITYTVSTL